MAMKKMLGNEEVYQCMTCGYYYEVKELAEDCETFCEKEEICSYEITKQSIKI